jgi:Ca2+-transporting ATPase
MALRPYHSLRPIEVYEALGTSPEGLSPGEAAARHKVYGKNVLAEKVKTPTWHRILAHLTHPLSGLLWIAGGISFVAQEPVLGIVIWLLVLVNAGFSFWREHRTEQAMLALRQLLPAYARLIREGHEISLPADEIVPGDVLVLAEGDNISADARVVEEFGLRTNNTVLTGETMPSRKTSDASLREGISEVERPNLVFAGTSIVSGTGKAVVFSTGMHTQFGRIAYLTQAVKEEPSPFQVELERITRTIAIVALVTGIAVFISGPSDVGLENREAFLLALGIIVAIIPEGLPAMLTLTLAIAGQRLSQRGVLIKKLSAIETLGTISTICTDKSGTLTQNQMTVREIWLGGKHLVVSGSGYEPLGKINSEQLGCQNEHDLDLLLSAATLCNNSRLSPPSPMNGRWSALGDQTEAALRVAALKGHIDENELSHALPRIHELPFDAHRKRMSTIHRFEKNHRLEWFEELIRENSYPTNQRGEVAFVKGAPREMLQICKEILSGKKICSLDESQRQAIEATIDQYAMRGLRVLALGFRPLPPRTTAYTPNWVERDLTFLGLMAMLDPPRPEVSEAVQILRRAGIHMVMITGDYGLTAESLGRRIGLIKSENALIVTGAELDELDEPSLAALLDKEVIFARMDPEHKLRLVSAFQARGEVVAVMGDGVNDAPALRKADIGVVMGVTGTDVAKEAADVVLVNDNFATITNAVEEGRAIYDNLRKFMTYIFASNVPEVLPFILTALFKIPLALSVQQILAIDLGTDLLPGLALGSEKPEPDIMQRQPRRRNQRLLERGLMVRAFLWLGLIETILAYTGFLLVYGVAGRGPLAGLLISSGLNQRFGLQSAAGIPATTVNLLAVTAFHAGVVLAQVGNAFACRSATLRVRNLGWLSNRFLIVGVMVEIGLITLLIYVPFLAETFNHAPLPSVLWLWLLVYPFSVYGTEWIRKRLANRLNRDSNNGTITSKFS